jgi:hypothetical protein
LPETVRSCQSKKRKFGNGKQERTVAEQLPNIHFHSVGCIGNECCECVSLDPDVNTGTKLYLLSDSRADICLLKSKNLLGTVKFEPKEKVGLKSVDGTVIETHGSIKATFTLQRGVTSAARHSVNITCRGVTSTARHAALSHSFDYISTIKGENVIGLLCTCSQRSWLSYGVGDSSYKLLLHFFLSSRSLGFLFAVPNFTGSFMGLWNKEVKYQTKVIAFVTSLTSVALKWCMTSPSYIKRLFVSSRLIWRLGFFQSYSLLQRWRQVQSVCGRMRLNRVC